MKVIGISKQDRVSKSTGNKYRAVILHCTYESKNINGLGAEQIFCKEEFCDPAIGVGDEIKVSYNRFRSVESVELVM